MFADTRDQLLTSIQQRLLSLGPGRVAESDLEMEQEFIAIGAHSPEAVRWLAAQREFGVPDSYDRYYEIGQLLVRVLDKLDPPGEFLCRLATDDQAPRYVQVSAIKQLAKRHDTRLLEPLLNVVANGAKTGEVRSAALAALAECGFSQALPLVQELDGKSEEQVSSWYGAQASLLQARGQLGDLSALRDLIVLVYDPWWHDSRCGHTGLAALLSRIGGLGSALSALWGPVSEMPLAQQLATVARHETGAVRRWALDRLGELNEWGRACELALDFLQDEDWLVASGASSTLYDKMPDPPSEALAQIAGDAGAPRSQRLWATYTLLRLGADLPDGAAQIPDLRVTLPGLVLSAVREAIVRAWAPESEPGTDVRWLIEALQLPPAQQADYSVLVPRLLSSLRAAGLQAESPVDYASVMMQGTSTFDVLTVSGHQLALSGLGPFVAAQDATFPPEWLEGCRDAAIAAGWTWLDNAMLETEFSGLNVYYFGDRRPLKIGELLYYWQD